MNNSHGEDDVCDGDPRKLGYKTVEFYFVLLGHINYGIGLFGNSVSLIAFVKQLKFSLAYHYQIYIIVLDILGILANFPAQVGRTYLNVWSAPEYQPDWLKSSRFFIEVFSRSYAAEFMYQTCACLLMIGVTIDRLYAMYQPMKYVNLNQKRYALVLFLSSLVVGIGLNSFILISVEPVWVDTRSHYILKTLDDFSLTFAYVFGKIHVARTFLQLSLLGILFILAVALSLKYRKVQAESKQIRRNNKRNRGNSSTSTTSSPVSEKTLTKLLFCQVGLLLVSGVACSFETLFDWVVEYPWCHMAPNIALNIELVMMNLQLSWNFVVYAIMSRRFRMAFVAVLRNKPIADEMSAVTAAASTHSKRNNFLTAKEVQNVSRF